MRIFLLCSLVAMGSVACSSSSDDIFGRGGSGGGGSAVTSTSVAGPATATSSAANATTATGSSTGSGMACTADGAFPDFEKGCGSPENCIIKLHQVDCCGSREAIGVNHSQFEPFDAAETAWEGACPACGCAAQPTLAEDGQTGPNRSLKVDCVEGMCKTFFE